MAVPTMLGSAPLPRPRKCLTLATPPSAGAKGCERDSHPESNSRKESCHDLPQHHPQSDCITALPQLPAESVQLASREHCNDAAVKMADDTLYTLAADTGGKALLDYNDLASGIVAAEKSITGYYIIGYYTTNDALDGKLRRVKVSLSNGAQAKLEYRERFARDRK